MKIFDYNVLIKLIEILEKDNSFSNEMNSLLLKLVKKRKEINLEKYNGNSDRYPTINDDYEYWLWWFDSFLKADRFCDYILDYAIKDGSLLNLLKVLKNKIEQEN